jgi:hypothetical protein
LITLTSPIPFPPPSSLYVNIFTSIYVSQCHSSQYPYFRSIMIGWPRHCITQALMYFRSRIFTKASTFS